MIPSELVPILTAKGKQEVYDSAILGDAHHFISVKG